MTDLGSFSFRLRKRHKKVCKFIRKAVDSHKNINMRTSFDIPDELFTEAKLKAVKEGISMKDLFTRALQNELQGAPPAASVPLWKQLQGTGSTKGVPASDSPFETYSGPEWSNVLRLNERD
jgi:hypothetical protein